MEIERGIWGWREVCGDGERYNEMKKREMMKIGRKRSESDGKRYMKTNL